MGLWEVARFNQIDLNAELQKFRNSDRISFWRKKQESNISLEVLCRWQLSDIFSG